MHYSTTMQRLSYFLIFLTTVQFFCGLSILFEPKNPYIIDIKAGVLRIKDNVLNGNAVSGHAPQPGLDGCKSYECPEEQIAVRTPYSIDNVINGTDKHFYCICAPETDEPLLNLILRVADLTSTAAASRERWELISEKAQALSEKARAMSRRPRALSRRVETVVKDTNFTYIPPPKADVTPDLLAESLQIQPQDTATVGSVMPHFQDGVISYGVQLNGLVASTMTLNASTALPCANIGAAGQAQPDLALRPKDIDNGTAQPYIPDCNIVAVNMYDPNVINYWVINAEGAIFSLVGSNKVMQINQLNSTASVSLVLRAAPASNSKRDIALTVLENTIKIAKRAMSQPDLHTATMTAEACAAIKCNNNGGQAAVFNPFTKTCWCRDPAYVEIEHV